MSAFHPIRGQAVRQVKVQRAKELRRAMTPEERILWQHVRGGNLHSLRIRRQQVLFGFIADFYCHAACVVIEVDGSSHAVQPEYDHDRGQTLEAHGLVILRFANGEVRRDLPRVLARIAKVCQARIETSPPSPSPRRRGAIG
jgi:very-short-patch-repair endonuclease